MRENFVTYNDEPDEDKVAALLDKASRDAEYVLHKVCARCLAPRSSALARRGAAMRSGHAHLVSRSEHEQRRHGTDWCGVCDFAVR